ncbi:hypothetical protein [Actinopolymorpha alba]|uniref:hypothetical protein n=1 Tax=Actinopolymorpha alba TaxID=533267 RepID=UPI00036F2281|nr:hypothetical protein [Actinopolymorpha alba]
MESKQPGGKPNEHERPDVDRDPPAGGAPDQARHEARRTDQRADRIGSLLPERAAEDEPERWGDRAEDSDAWYLNEMPPHHGS